MLYLLLAIACSVLLGFIFKLFARFGVNGFQAIVFNYFTCFCCGWLHLGRFPLSGEDFDAPWMPYALILGLIFVSGFNMAEQTVRHFGVTIGQIMQKMSILITVPFAILAYQESAGWVKILGLVLALASIILVNWSFGKKGQAEPTLSAQSRTNALANTAHGYWWIPLATWLLAGLLEVLLVRVQKEGYADMSDPTFIITIFGMAGCTGLSVAMAGWFTKRLLFSWKDLLAGLVLGIPNYGSMLFMLFALNSGLEGSFVFPVANVGIIVVTTLGAVTLFQERLTRLNWIGIGLALVGIALISL